jgi:potassium-transporting ATPase KdpC subunit
MNLLKQAVICLAILMIITGILYPLAVTGLAQLIFPYQANGSMISMDNKVIGSELIGQQFSSQRYFWSRPSATSPMPYNAANSSGSNLGPLNPVLMENVRDRSEKLRKAGVEDTVKIPVDLITASGSGLDPDISFAAAECQISRVARERNIDETKVRELVAKCAKGRQWEILGEPRINVLELNLALDSMDK